MRFTVLMDCPEGPAADLTCDDETGLYWFMFDVDDRQWNYKVRLEAIAEAAERLRYNLGGKGAVIRDVVEGGFFPRSFYGDPLDAQRRFDRAERPLDYGPTADNQFGGGS